MEYQNFKICVEPGHNGSYEVEAAAPKEATAEDSFSLRLNQEELTALRSSLGDPAIDENFLITFGESLHERYLRLRDGKTHEDYLVAYGQLLHKRLFAPNICRFFDKKYGEFASGLNEGMRICLTSKPEEICAIPWELLYDSTQSCFLSTSTKTPLTRYVKLSTSVPDFGIDPPIKILVVIPHAPELDAPREKKLIEDAFDSLKGSLEVEVDYLEGEVTTWTLSQKLTNQPDGRSHHIIHYIGHGVFHNNQGHLLITPEANNPNPMLARGTLTAETFAETLHEHPSIKLVVLNACQTATTASTRPFASVAQQLALKNVPAVIAMQYPIDDAAAVIFSREFYLKLCAGQYSGRVDTAISYARHRLHQDFKNVGSVFCAFATPVLYLRSSSGRLFEVKKPESVFSPHYLQNRSDYVKVYRENIVELERKKEETEQVRAPAVKMEEVQKDISKQKAELKRVEGEIRRWYATVGLLFAACITAVILAYVGLFDVLRLDDWVETRFVDFMDERFMQKKALSRTQIVMMDQASADRLGDLDVTDARPWRANHVKLLEALGGQAEVIAFDLSFHSESELDEEFRAAIKKAENAGGVEGVRKTKVVLGLLADENTKKLRPLAPTLSGLTWGELSAAATNPFTHEVRKYKLARPPVEGQAGKNGEVEVTAPSLALQAVLQLLSTEADQPVKAFYDEAGQYIRLRRGGEGGEVVNEIPVDDDLDYYIYLARREDVQSDLIRHPYHVVLEKKEKGLPFDNFHDQIVLVGPFIRDVDLHKVTGDDKRYGVEVHANVISNILQKDYIYPLRRTGYSYLLMAVMALLGVLVQTRFRGKMRMSLPQKLQEWISWQPQFPALLIIIPMAYLLTVVMLYKQWRILFDMNYHLAAFFIAYFIARLFTKKFGWASPTQETTS